MKCLLKSLCLVPLLLTAIASNAQRLTINISYTAESGNARRYADEMISKGIVDSIRAIPGCLKYEFYIPVDNPDGLLLIDEWESQEALDRYHRSKWMNEAATLREKYQLTREVRLFTPKNPPIENNNKTQQQ